MQKVKSFANLAMRVSVAFVAVLVLAMPAKASMGDFSVTLNLPENQIPGTPDFFNLRVTPGETQEIGLTINNNNTEEDIVVSLELFTAITNRNGIMDYSLAGIPDITMLHPLADIATLGVGPEVTIPAGESLLVPITIEMPAAGFHGIILGSINVALEPSEADRAAAGMLVNRFVQATPIRLQYSDVVVEPDFELGEVGAGMFNHRASIIAEIRNTQSRITRGVSSSAWVYPVGSDSAIFTRVNFTTEFAPNSVFEFSLVDDAGYGVHPGDYRAVVILEHEGREWRFEQYFTIEEAEAVEINEAAVNQGQQRHPAAGQRGLIQNVLIICLAGVIIIILVFLVVKKRNQKLPQDKLEDDDPEDDMDIIEEQDEETEKVVENESSSGQPPTTT